MNFDDAFERVITNEGHFQNLNYDRGNWTGGKIGKGELRGTKYGISAAAYPNLDIESLTLEQAKEIYYRDYWIPLIEKYQIPEPLRFTLFDIAVNSGIKTAIRLLQLSAGAVSDGIIGPKTMAAIIMADTSKLLIRLHAFRLLHITKLEAFTHFGRTWVMRTANNMIDDVFNDGFSKRS